MSSAAPNSTASDVTVLDIEGHTLPIASLWERRPAVIVFLRHFG